ncbi:hypothetical protein BDW66DRAFT_128284 [Aspergillus desertorum]
MTSTGKSKERPSRQPLPSGETLDASESARQPSHEALVSRFAVQLLCLHPPPTGSTEKRPLAVPKGQSQIPTYWRYRIRCASFRTYVRQMETHLSRTRAPLPTKTGQQDAAGAAARTLEERGLRACQSSI